MTKHAEPANASAAASVSDAAQAADAAHASSALYEPVSENQLAEQLAYYSNRAPEYDDWWHRRGTFDRGPEENALWLDEAQVVLDALNAVDLGEELLELAPGTGTWSIHVVDRVKHLTLVDGSAEMLALNPASTHPNVTVHIADLFRWSSDQSFDSALFAFWISHVPRERLVSFFESLASWLKPGGTVFFVDDLPRATSEPHVTAASGQTMVRQLNDGRDATIIKNFFLPDELVSAAAAAGIELEVHATSTFFQYGCGRRIA